MISKNKQKQLLEVLRIIADESVKKAKDDIKESNDPAQNSYIASLEKSEEELGVGLVHEEDEGGFQSDDEPEQNKAVDSQEKPKQEPEQSDKEPPMDPDTFSTSFDKVMKDINTLRAGRSTKDKEIKHELMGYYDRLSDDERTVLHIFLKQISSILSGALSGEEAIDPSDSPFNASINIPDGEEDQEQKGPESEIEREAKPQADDENQEDEEKKNRRKSGGIEDTTPPIKVNESQDLTEIRKIVKKLMRA